MLLETLELIGLPAAVLTPSRRLVAANRLLEKLIPHVVQEHQCRIGLADRRADAMLEHALSEPQSPTGGQFSSIPIARTREQPATIVHVLPVRPAEIDIFGAASCVLIFTSVGHPEMPSAEIIQSLFNLTPAEARIARGIAAGKTVDELARGAGLTVGTVRQQLKAVFSKTGVSRQAELVGILVGCALRSQGNSP